MTNILNSFHTPVLLKETLDLLNLKSGEVVFEGTGGLGGYTEQIAKRLGPCGKLIVTELDRQLAEHIRERLRHFECQVFVIEKNFREIKSILLELKINKLDVIILDLGLSSYHIEHAGRGFSVHKSEPLLMTFSETETHVGSTANEIVNHWSEQSLRDIFIGFGGEKRANKIAKAIIFARHSGPIESSSQLAKIVESVISRKGRLHSATKVFQAIRMAANDEFGALKQILSDGWRMLGSDGRVAVITFHEVEDRLVKQFFAGMIAVRSAKLVNKKPIVAKRAEVKENIRSRSAKLRVIIKV